MFVRSDVKSPGNTGTRRRRETPASTTTATTPTAGAPRPGGTPGSRIRAATPRNGTTTIAGKGLRIPRRFTAVGHSPYAEVEWETRTASITGEGGQVFFEQQEVEVPRSWSQVATNVVAQKYFRGILGTPRRERSVRQLVGRVTSTIARWGREQGTFASEEDAAAFEDEIAHLVLQQKMAFNSPVWFNVGVEDHPQCSACFINSVDDTMESILELAKTEGMLFKFGSGTGTNFSRLRSSKENLAGGGTASGPVSFMKGFDAFAGVIKSGGKTRRAAKMVILDIDHPDIVEYIRCKAEEERKAWALIDAGYDGSFNGVAYGSVFFQNSNNSVRVSDEFMRAVERDDEWQTRMVRSGEVADSYRARELFRMIADAGHQCGDPGMQFDTTVNSWHTCPRTARINASNPCSEYMFVDDSACNLASLNLLAFLGANGEFDVDGYRHAIALCIVAQEIIVDAARYPTDRIADNSHRFRALGLGYANLGALLMALGLPYDSAPGRAYAAALTALMTGQAYATSAHIAAEVSEPFAAFADNRQPFLDVISKHRQALTQIDAAYVPINLWAAAREAWDEALALGLAHGYRNAQVTVLAPTGTIGFMMDCATTGVEPDIALVKFKRLVGGGTLKMVNPMVGRALERLGYDPQTVGAITSYIEENATIEGAPGLRDEHLPVFDCAFRAPTGMRCISPMGHVQMMASVQPFLSGAISKTVNLPSEIGVEEIEDIYLSAWKLGLKAIAIYRDGCKRTQPVAAGHAANQKTAPGEGAPAGVAEQIGPLGAPEAVRRKLPDERHSITHKFSVGGHEGYIHVGMYEDGSPGELFVRMAKEGSTIAGLMDSFATAVSLALQHGVPLHLFADKFSHTRFEPSGFTGNPEIPRASSIMDYIFRWLESKFLRQPPDELAEGSENTSPSGPPLGLTLPLPLRQPASHPVLPLRLASAGSRSSAATGRGNGHGTASGAPGKSQGGGVSSAMATAAGVPFGFVPETDAPACPTCGAIMVRSGACHKCLNCGTSNGCS